MVARDAAGHASAASASSSATLPEDRGEASVPVVTAPQPGLATGSVLATTRPTGPVPVRLTWSGTDDVGITGYALARSTDGGRYVEVARLPGTATSTLVRLSPGRHRYRFRLVGEDAAGGTSAGAAGPAFGVHLAQEDAATCAGPWTVATHDAASGGRLRRSTSGHSAATYRFRGSAFAWVAPTAPTAGRASVSVDGRAPTVVDLRMGSGAGPRRVVTAVSGLAPGPHRVLVQLPGARDAVVPRVAVDAFVSLD